ncbi:MAG: membrane protein insertase YidC, partial [candidate division Zixibacteria bacterium]|nr:membrane protein insertase YidC [candidate division Zixibacteria bacterium]
MNEERSPIDTKVMMAFAVLVALVLLLPTYWEWIGFKPAPKPISKMADSTATAFPSAADTSSLSNRSTIRSRITNDSAKSIFVVDSAWSGETVQVTTPKYEASFSTQGARLARLVLKDYRYTDPERHDQPIVLLDTVDAAAGGGPGFQFDSPEIDLSLAQFRVDRTSVSLAKEDSGSVRFTVRTKSGNEWAVIYTFRGDRYDFQTRLLVPAPWQDGVERELHYGWQGGLWPTEPDPAGDNNDFAAVALMGKDLERIGKVDHDQPVSNLSGQTYWAAVRTKYFVCATIPATEAGGFRSVGRERFIPFEGKTIPLKQFDALVRVDLRTGEPIDLAFRVYAGPIDYDVLKSYGVGLEQMVNLGWRWLVRPFALVFLWLFQRLYAVFANYGIVIIIFSLLIKTIFHPLTKKQIRSMRKMQALQPKMEKLKERFKDDAQRLNQEMMKMYREAGINPMAGCLPLLPQMPIFYALFQVFRTSIELRGAHFVFWLTDLSQKDPYYILPILMTICMFAQQTLSTKDPKQKMMTYMMPLLFGFMFRNFPAGLTLYWTMFNIFSIIEQVWLIG